jgi:hypothetical protein
MYRFKKYMDLTEKSDEPIYRKHVLLAKEKGSASSIFIP